VIYVFKPKKLMILTVLSIMVSACGGGEDSDTPQPPVFKAGILSLNGLSHRHFNW
jgi:hypothetical protein